MKEDKPSYVCSGFLQDRDECYAMLEEMGFEDIEIHTPGVYDPCPPLKESPPNCIEYCDEIAYEEDTATTTSEYFRAASEFLWDNQFDSKTAREVWLLHSEGRSFKEISDAMGWKSTSSSHHHYTKIKRRFQQWLRTKLNE